MTSSSIKRTCFQCVDIFRDFAFILLMGINIGFQVFVFTQLCLNISNISGQCRMVNIYTFGIIAQTAAMVLITSSMIYVYCVRHSVCDPFLVITTFAAITWLFYALFGSWKSYMDCKKPSYPIASSIVVLGVDVGICLVLLLSGARHSIRYRKRERPAVEEPSRFIRDFSIPRLNDNLDYTGSRRTATQDRITPQMEEVAQSASPTTSETTDHFLPVWTLPQHQTYYRSMDGRILDRTPNNMYCNCEDCSRRRV